MKHLLVLAVLVALSGCDGKEAFRIVQPVTVLAERKATGEIIPLELSVGHTFRAEIVPLTEEEKDGRKKPKIFATRRNRHEADRGVRISLVPHKTTY